jgi:hypothetical protein
MSCLHHFETLRILLNDLPTYTGMVGMMGVAAVTKKRGGYTNTKLHGMIAWAGLILAGGGLYVIYQHKESMGKNHYTTYHSWGESVIESIHHDYLCLQAANSCGLRCLWNCFIPSIAGLSALGGCVMPGLAGGVMLHPDFGIDKQNKLVRAVHKYASRVLLTLAWMATLSGLKTLVGDDLNALALFAVPLVVAGKFTLM